MRRKGVNNGVTAAAPKTGQGASSLKDVFLLTPTYNFLLLLMITYHYVLFFLLVNFFDNYICMQSISYMVCVCSDYTLHSCAHPLIYSYLSPTLMATTPRTHQSPSQIHDI